MILQKFEKRIALIVTMLVLLYIIKNRQYAVWELYQLQIIAIAAGFVVLLLLVAFLSVMTRRLNSVHLALTRLNAGLEIQVQERTAVLSRTNHNLEMEITERKQAEEALANVRMMLESAFEQTPVPMVLVSMPDAVLRIANTACREFLGILDEPTPVGQRLIDFNPSYQDYDAQGNLTPLAEAPLARVVLLGQRTLNQERRIVTKDGTTHWALVSGNPIYNSSGDLIAAHLVFPDITDRKRIEEERLHLNESLEQRVAQELENNLKQERLLIQQSRMAAMGEMIGNIAHQWRQPLNALGLLLYNIKDAYRFNTLDAEYLDQVVSDGRRMVQKMSTTISDFSNFFRPDKEIGVFSAMKQIRDAIALVESSFLNSNISIHVDAPRDLNLSGFPNEYSQVLLNLLSNAKEAILARNQPHQSSSGRVDIVLAERGGKAIVSVRDNGGGIPIDILDRIFDPYFSTKESGTGIGLYMSKMIIERNMKGSITARNIKGGAEFIVASPLAKDGPHEPYR